MAQEPTWLTEDEQRAWQGYRRMARLLDARLARDLARDSQLSPTDYDVLSSLSDRTDDRWGIKELGNHLQWSPSRLSHHLDRMQKRGLVYRDTCTVGRGADAVLTPEGRAAIESAAPDHVRSVRRAFVDCLTRDDLATLTRISAIVVDRITEG